LVDVIIQKAGRVTRQMMCEPCGLAAAKGLNQMMLHGQDAADLVHQTALEYTRGKKKWWQFWK